MSETEPPFERIQDHRDVMRDIRQMRDNLNELEQQVRIHEWMTLGGGGAFMPEKVEKLCDGVERGMPYILEGIRELGDPYDTQQNQGGNP